MKLTTEQLVKLRDTALCGSGDIYNSMQRAVDLYERMRPAPPKLPQWHDSWAERPTEGDLNAYGEIAVKHRGAVFCTGPESIPDGAEWMGLQEIASLPPKDYGAEYLAERPEFEKALKGKLNFERYANGDYLASATTAAWLSWAKAKGLK